MNDTPERPTNVRYLTPGQSRPQIEEALATLQANAELLMEYHRLKARLEFNRYASLVDAGFPPEQALFLCKDLT